MLYDRYYIYQFFKRYLFYIFSDVWYQKKMISSNENGMKNKLHFRVNFLLLLKIDIKCE